MPGGLIFALDDVPGIRRRGRRRFHYVDELTGATVDDADTLTRIRALAVPPAWTDVWLATDPRSHLQATGRDARGRKQYRYHPDFRQQQEEAKFDDARLAQLVRRCQDLPGQVLFQYLDDDESPRPLRSTDVNDYLRAASGLDATAKTFRTWSATLMAATGLARLPPASRREGARAMKDVLTLVSSQLNNTPAVCRRSYIHPSVIDGYLDATLPGAWQSATARGSSLLCPEERRLLIVLDAIGSTGTASAA